MNHCRQNEDCKRLGDQIVLGDTMLAYPLGQDHLKKALSGMSEVCNELGSFFTDNKFPRRWADAAYCSELPQSWQEDCLTRIKKPLPEGLLVY